MKKPDLNGPRFRNKRISVLTTETLKEFKKKYPEHSDMDYKKFKSIIMTFNKNITQGIIDNRNGVELPDGLGYIFMGSCPKSKKENIDFKKSIEFGTVATHKNWDSDHKLLKIFYSNHATKYPFKHKRLWSFKAVKHFRQKASEAYKENYAKYMDVDPSSKVSTLFEKRKSKSNHISNYKPIIPENYDEFDL